MSFLMIHLRLQYISYFYELHSNLKYKLMSPLSRRGSYLKTLAPSTRTKDMIALVELSCCGSDFK